MRRHWLVSSGHAERHRAGHVGWLRAASDRFRYWGDDAKTEGSYHGEHFTLRDMGYMDADGFLYLTDRTANLIISGGVNIYPAEVDAVLLDHPSVLDVATIGVPDEEWGEAVKAVVQPADGVERRGLGVVPGVVHKSVGGHRGVDLVVIEK